MKPETISHVGIAVVDLESAISDYSKLFDFDSIERFDMEVEGVRIAMLKTGATELELLSPTGPGSIQNFIQKRGEGLHHVAIRVGDVAKAIELSKTLGLRVLDEKPRKGARGAEAAFVHPQSFHGVLLEFYSR
ncbi:MAG: methylmalonyl-CoA epimerase [Nitrososphaerales archaeon]